MKQREGNGQYEPTHEYCHDDQHHLRRLGEKGAILRKGVKSF